jgi:hypothetical protein
MNNNYHNNTSRAGMNINDIKYDLLKISEMFDGLLIEGLGHLAADMFCKYLQDMCDERLVYSFEITDIVLKEHSYTYDVNVQITNDRTPKKLKIHVGLYKSAWPALSKSMKNTDAGYVNA